MRVVAVLANKEHPELGAISIPIPIRAGEYSSVMKMLSALGIGDAEYSQCHDAYMKAVEERLSAEENFDPTEHAQGGMTMQ